MNYWKKIVAAVATVPMLAAFVPTATAADVTPALAQSAPAAAASDPQLLASWDFTGKDGTNNGSIADSTGKYNLTLNGGVSVVKFGDRSNNEALNLNNDANSAKYAQIDDQLFKDAGDSFTLEFAAKSRQADSDAFFTFAVGKDYNKYFFNRISTTKVKTVISDNKWNNEQGDNVDVTDNNNKWHDYKIAVDGTNLAVWRDGTPIIFKANTSIKMSDLGGYTTYIGKSFYDGSGSGIGTDKYWNGAIDDIKVYKGASLTAPTGVAISGDGVVDGKLALTEKSTAKLTATVTPDDAVSKDVTWTSSDDKVATVAADGTVTAVKQGTATITATAFGGVKAELPVTVNPLDPKSAATEDLDAAISALKKTTTENLPLVAEGTKHGSAITWTSSDPKLVTGTDADYKNTTTGADDPYKGAGVVTRPAYGDGDSKPVTLTATASYNDGEKVTKTVEVTVKEKTRTAPDTGYASVTFESDGNGGEKAWVASTEKNDFFTFKTRNNGKSVLTNDADTGGLRDMFVLRSHEGDKYYLIATDLKVSSMGWSQNQQYGSHKVEVYESTDMMNWTRTNGDGNGGITINSPNAGMTWAPEAYWDDDLNAYVVFFSSRMYTDETRKTPVKNETTGRSSYAQVRYSITRDFVNFTEPQTWQDTGYSRIDSTVRKIGGYYYRFTKNEESGKAGDYITTGKSVFLERSKVLTAPTTKADPDQDPNTGWQLLEQALLPFEGPETVKLNKDDELNTKDDDGYILLSDNFAYRAFMTTGSELSKTTWDNPMTKRYPDFNNEKKPVKAEPGAQGYITKGAEGGLPDKVRHGAFVNVPQTVLDVTKTWTTSNPTHIQAVDSTTKAAFDKDSRKLTATVTAADKGTLAGSVTFTAGDWTETAKLDAKGKASVTVPAEVKGDVTVAYDGYTDGLVKASSATYNVEEGEVTPPEAGTPLIHYSFDKAIDGKTVTNEGSAADSDATLSGEATVENGQIKLTGSQTIEVPTTAIKGQQDVTLSVWLKNNYGSGNVAAAYIGNAATKNGYLLLNPSNPKGYVKPVMTTATAANPNASPWNTEVGPGSTNAATSGAKATSDLALYTVVINGSKGTMSFYLNGEAVGDKTYAIPAGGLTNYGDLVAYIGKSAYADPNTKIDVDDYAVYGSALPAGTVAALYAEQALDKAVAAVTVPESATKDFTLPTSAAGASVAWKSDNDAIKVDAKGNAVVTRPSAEAGDATVTLTATFTIDGKTATKTYKVTVPKQLSDKEKAQADLDALEIENADDIRGNFSVATKGSNGSEITWKVTEGGDNATVGDGVNSKSATVTVKRPAAGKDAAKVTLTAIVKNGTATLTKTFEVTVQPMPVEEDDQAYVWAFFTGEGQGAEKISLAASKGNDALDWNTLNNGQPLFTSEFGEKGLRDPFIIRSKDGDKFYMLATDLKIAGRAGSFDTAQRNGSKYIEVWKSDDLVNWSKQSHVKVSSDYAGNTWAPEAYYDEEIGKYVVYWASNLYDTTDNSLTARPSVTYNRMIYVTTDDFVNFSDPQVWVNVNQGQGKGMIDATIAKQDGVYYRFYKDESRMKIREEKSTNLLSAIGSADKPGSLPKQTGLAASDQWTLVKENIGDGQNNQYGGKFSGGEGPSVFPANKGDVNGNKWYLFMDQPNYHGGPNHYIGFTTDDLSTGDVTAVKYKNLPTNADGGKPRHGTVVPVTRAQYQKVLEAYAKNVAVTSVNAVNVATNVGDAPKLPETVHLTHADGSEADVAVVWDEVKADSYAKTGTFTVKGVAQDDSRMPVEATVTVNGIDISGATVTVEPKEFTADGAAKEPKVTVTLADGTELKAGDDYTVTYANNVEPGTATVTVTGAGKYSGTATATFEIKKADETKPTVDKSDLQSLYDKVKGYQEADYQSGWAAFKAALDKAYGLLQSSDASQPDVDQALKDLQSAVDKLVKKPAAKPQPTKPATTANTGSAIAGVTALAALTLAAGVALTVWRKRRA
ncbi:immunoglobulin-like domain-containing protein [Bifidobacterium aesculapii]|uniref:immunoglobulin-like domain-containing protein n=1 Tax=Bifidobacterium aesculapii TaxID=1329411 RepID=UPI000AE0AD4F|nr:immunoglobulin-like domain-containing protein [Bifidobacterium aesculapii]